MAKSEKRAKARKLVLLRTCDNVQVCEALVIVMQCDELSGREK